MKFNEPALAKLIRDHYVAVAVFHDPEFRRKDAEGEFYRKLHKEFPIKDPNAAVAFDAAGKMLGFENDPTPRVEPMLRRVLKEFESPAAPAAFPKDADVDAKRWPSPPKGGLVLHVNGMNLERPPTKAGMGGLGRSTLWVRKDEAEAIARGEFPKSLAVRIARFNVVDNTTGKSPAWKPEAIEKADFRLEKGRVTGPVVVEMARGKDKAWFRGHALGFVEAKGGKVTRFDLVIRGEGHGLRASFNPDPPFPLALTFRLADPADEVCRVPPPGYWHDPANYLR